MSAKTWHQLTTDEMIGIWDNADHTKMGQMPFRTFDLLNRLRADRAAQKAEEAALNEEKIQQCAIAAYRALGYPVVNFGKGEAPGILRCPPKTIRLMNEFQARLCAALLGEKARGA